MRLVKTVIAALLAVAVASPVGARGASDPEPRARRDLYSIPFASGTVDPLFDWKAANPATKDLVLVQFERFGIPSMVDRVAATGATLVQPLAPVSYIVWADAATTMALRELNGVRWAGVLPAETRVADSVTTRTTRLRVTLVGTGSLPGFDAGAAWTRPFTATGGVTVEIAGTRADASRIARLPYVYSIADAGGAPQLRDERSDQIVAGNIDKDGVPRPGYEEFLDRFGVDGSGVIVGHVDGGVDFNHPELSDRIEACIDYTLVPFCTIRNNDDIVGHGTFTAGIVAGTGSSNLGDSEGFAYGQGMAPGATLVVQNAINAATELSDPFAEGYRPLYRDSHDAGAIVSQNSWGPAGTPQGYDEATREFDTMPRDINEDKAGDQPLALVFSVMNGQGGKSTQGSPDEAKNIIAVGGTGDRHRITDEGPGYNDLCTCSAHGPALDGRLLPTIVAPAQFVMSTRAAQGTLCGLIGSATELPPSPIHAPCTGTSFASPHVSGSYALFVQWYRKKVGGTPSPALVKAAFVNQALDLSTFGGVDADGEELDPIPNPQQGWGRLDLGATLGAWRDGALHVDQKVVFSDSRQSHELTIRPRDPRRPLKATLVWTDALGHGKGGELPAWVNDLDLVVKQSGRTWRGNVFRGGWSMPGGKADRMNNTENVYLKRSGNARLTISVIAANIIGDALPNNGDRTDQDFALVVSNARISR